MTIRVPGLLRAALAAEAERRELTASEAIRQALALWLATDPDALAAELATGPEAQAA